MDKPLRDLAQEEIDSFHHDGVICARQIVPCRSSKDFGQGRLFELQTRCVLNIVLLRIH